MNLIDKIFKIGLLLIGSGFLAAYFWQVYTDGFRDRERYVMTVGNTGNVHTVYLLNTTSGEISYAMGKSVEPLEWKVTRPSGRK